ncbi:MAG: chemotaxis protein CheB [Thermodesulfobacteriota bacterium]
MPKKKSIKNTDNNKCDDSAENSFPVVGLGASAGGLEALKSFFSKLPEKSGMAFIVVMHLKPGQPSMMPDLIQKITKTPVTAAEDGQTVEPDHIYVIPPGKDINVYNGCIQLMDQVKKPVPLPVDHFFRSLAMDRGNKAAGVILSGTGSDGTLGIKEIKACDGLVLAQSRESAGYDGMPASAAGTGVVDLVLPPEEMPNVLIQYFLHMGSKKAMEPGPGKENKQQDWLNKIFAVLRTRVGHDFSYYKTSTILRRIERRMGLNHISGHETYLRFMRENPAEVDALFREFLIGVTSFFREPESFERLAKDILPDFFNKFSNDETFRVWIPGCSTGEEVYSLAMVLLECLDRISGHIGIQLFGTDIDNDAIEKARQGVYPASISAHVSEDRLKRFFKEEEGSFRIKKEIRDCAVFSTQDIIKDPPFPRIHLLCCRNLLIYLDEKAQKKVLPVFHYTLNPGGILMLGSSETIGSFSNLFKPLNSKCKIFMRQEVPRALRQIVDFPSGTPSVKGLPAHISEVQASDRYSDIGQLTRKAVMDQFAPTAVLIDGQGELLHVHGRTGKYLETPSGPPTNNILDLCREGLRIHLSSALREAKSSGTRQTRQRLTVKTNGDVETIDLHVCPQSNSTGLAGRFLVAFEKVADNAGTRETEAQQGEESHADSARVDELEKELRITRESHQATIEELESSNEELKSTNEEVQSANEELQSTNEELESSKEELQSLNEELQTVNSELQSKVAELSSAHDDMQNLLENTEIATIFVDKNMCVRRFTPQATQIVNLISSDIGRPLRHVVSNLENEHMIRDLEEVHKKLIPKEKEVRTELGKWYNMRIMPYRTTDNRIDGLVITFSGIHEQILQQQRLQQAKNEAETTRELLKLVFNMNPDPMAVLDHDGNIVIANTGFFRLIGFASEDAEQDKPITFPTDIFTNAELEKRLKNAYENGIDFTTDPTELKTGLDGTQIAIHGRCIENSTDSPYRILLRFMESQSEEGPT